ncbi:MAG: glycosyltransferase family 2 protein [Ginsengibacter sp.]
MLVVTCNIESKFVQSFFLNFSISDYMLIYQNHPVACVAPFFSIIITTFNRASLLVRALDSLIHQTENDWEAILIDDGSMDDTQTRVLPFLKKRKNIRYIWQKSSGATFSKNKGILHSKGKFITFLDSDDEYTCEHLSIRKTILQQNEKIDFLYGGVKISGNPFVPDLHNYQKLVHLSGCVIGGSFFVRKELALAMKGFVEMPLGSDADLFERIVGAKAKIEKVTSETYIYHRETLNSITNNLANCEKSPDPINA